jgi:hypothetical protein
MTSMQKRRILSAVIFQSVFVFFLLFTVFIEASNPSHTDTNSNPIICVSSGSSVVVREAAEQLSVAHSFFTNQTLLEKIWRYAERVHSSKLFTSTALQLPGNFYNTFYILITIHAP